MSYPNGALRHRQTMVTEAGIASLAVQDANSEMDELKSKVHYIWNPFVDIPLVGPEGLRMRLGKGWSYYGMGIPGEDDGQVITTKRPGTKKRAESIEAYEQRGAGLLHRCVAYPCWNIYYKETKYNMGDFTEREGLTGNDLGAETPLRDRQQFAGVCAADFLSRYREDYGARVLVPFIGMDNDQQKTVAEIVKMVQPYAYKLTNLREEEEYGAEGIRDEETLLFELRDHGPADERIRGAKLDKVLTKLAQDVRRIMQGGVRAALVTGRADWADLQENLSNTRLGHKGFKKGPSEYDRQVAWLLGMPVPAAVVTQPAGDGELRKSVELLTQLAIERGATPQVNEANEVRDLIKQMRDERKLLEAERKRAKSREGTTE
jgi:hypothetical protein